MAAEQEEIPENIAAAITEISERATLLIRDEIELARAEIAAKVRKLVTGAVVGVVSGVFIVVAGMFILEGLAWLAWYEFFPAGEFFWGFFVMAGVLLALAVLGGVLAARALRRGPPAPTMAIDEARKIREAVAGPEPQEASS
ncbi:MAG TPA: phage holin family protein [Solirubrobacteraceae bacterium]|nr:phage holin family protein [Solirubrobacteraceae bacterium]